MMRSGRRVVGGGGRITGAGGRVIGGRRVVGIRSVVTCFVRGMAVRARMG